MNGRSPKLLGGSPKVVDGVTFRPYSDGIARSFWRSDAGAIRVRRNYERTTYSATVGQAQTPGYVFAGDRFRSFETAARAAIKAWRGS